ncbi:MAG: LmbE family protein [Actinomycetia bacterium]|nr:LmbE family protein [Actinomycetes bacterium]
MPRTLVVFHAHPDDECILTAGVMARAAAAGDRVVLVVATKGEVGEVDEGFLDPGESLADRRVLESEASCAVLGVSRLEFLGYRDSGMMGEPTNDEPGAFWRADVEEAAQRLAAILRDEQADVLTIYDPKGNYGHPDHIQVYRVGKRAGELAGTPRVFQATANGDHIRRLSSEVMGELPEGVDRPDPGDLGLSESEITTSVDVSDLMELKRAAMAAHASQIGDNSFFLALPMPGFTVAFGTEWFVREGEVPHGVVAVHDLFTD